jgi:hypothetical protein
MRRIPSGGPTVNSMRLSALAAAAAMAVFVLALAAGSVFGAILGSLDPSSAHPGDWVELTTDPGTGGPDVYASIAEAGPDPLWLQRADPNRSGNECDLRVGDLTWASGVGHARFQVLDVQPGSYWLLATVQGACWRFGDQAGVLTFTVLPPVDSGPSPVLLTVAIGALIVVVVSGGILVRRRRGPRSS